MDMVYAQWNYGKDPTKRLAYDEAWTSLQTEIANMGSSVLLDLIREHLVENTHYAVVQLFPKTGMVKEAEDVSIDLDVLVYLLCFIVDS